MPRTHPENSPAARTLRRTALAGALAAALLVPVSAQAATSAPAKESAGPLVSWHTPVIRTQHGIAGGRDCRVTVSDPNGVVAVAFTAPRHPEVEISVRRIAGRPGGSRQTFSCSIDLRHSKSRSVTVRAQAKSRGGASSRANAVTSPAETASGEGTPSTPIGSGVEAAAPADPLSKSKPKPEKKPQPESKPTPPVEAPSTPPVEAPPAPPTEAPPAPPVEVPSTPPTGAPAGTEQIFSPSSFWNRQLSPEAALVAKSPTYVSELVRLVKQTGSWINTSEYSTPVYVVGPAQPTVKVTIVPENGSPVDPRQQASLNAVPIPPGAAASRGTDRHMVVYQPSTNSMWEFWEMRYTNGVWTTDSSGAMNNVSTSVGYFNSEAWPGAQSWWGATATSLPLLGGLIRISELQSGAINHALALAIPEASSSYVWPAQRSDGRNPSPNAIPEGTTFRLPASLNIDSLNLPPATKAIAIAAQKYGIIVRDGSADVSFYGEDPTPLGTNPYNQLFSNQYPNTLLSQFPWSQLVAVAQSR